MLVRFLVPANIRHNSGGTVYNTRLAQGLRTLGVDTEVLAVDGSWPDASAAQRRRLGGVLGAGGRRADITAGTVTLVDGLIACGAPDELEYAAAAGRSPWVLLHMPAPSHPDGERRALRAAAGVICTSSSAVASIEMRHGLPACQVALPGTDPAPKAAGSAPPHIVAVAALLPNKDQLLTVAALARVQDLAWTASLVGTDDADSTYAAQVRGAIASVGLEGRVRVTGQLAGKALADEWNRADLSLLVSRAESFGLVVTESLARGIPVVVRKGTGAVEALGLAGRLAGGMAGGLGVRPAGKPEGATYAVPGAAVGLAGPDNSHPDVLAAVIRQWLLDGTLRAGWRAAALAAREQLPGWDSTARNVLAILSAPAGKILAEETPAEETPAVETPADGTPAEATPIAARTSGGQ
jgi:glycosyltransferase involved in cell wall biosynthesis